jgi:hypothetical protein
MVMLVALCSASFAYNSEWFTPLNQHIQSNTNIETVAVVYNPQTHPNLSVPARIQSARVILVPLSSTRKVAATFKRGVLAQTKLDLVYLVDDYSRAVTNQATSKYLQRLQAKRQFDLLSDNPDHIRLLENSEG